MRAPHVVVIGGGITGLTAAYQLHSVTRQAGTQLQITLVEAENRLGGKILTDRRDGLIIEAGPDSFLSAKPAALSLCQDLGLEDDIIGTTQSGGGTYILRSGRLQPLPEGITMLVPTKIRPLLASRLLSPWGKLRMGLDFFIPPRRDSADESVGQFVRRRLGSEAFEHMAQPLLSGIYAGDAEQLSLLATFPRLRETELKYGSLTKGMLVQRRQAKSSQPGAARRSAFLSLQGGLGTLIDTLAEALTEVDVKLGTELLSIERSGDEGYLLSLSNRERLQADALVLAIPAYVAGSLLARFDSALAKRLNEIPYVSTATATLAYRKVNVTAAGAGRGFVIPKVEGRELTAVTWVTNKFPGRAPEDVALVRAFVGRAGREKVVDLPDDELIHLIRGELKDILGINAEPIDAGIYRWRRALPQYVLGHNQRLNEIDELTAQFPGLVLAGAAYRGVGIPDCIQSGRRAADQLLAHLKLATGASAVEAA